MSHVVEDGELKRVSPSQLKTFYDCRRKWYYQKVLHVPEPKKPHLELGEKIHKQFEDWYQLAIPPTHDSVQLALTLPEVPERADTIIIEEPRNYDLGLLAAGIPLRGRIDVLIPPVDGRVVVLDWKSTSSWDWLKTPEDLARDAQGITYLQYAFNKYPEATEGVFRHVYVRTKRGRGAKSVETDALTREYIDGMYARLEVVVAEMKDTARIPNVDDVPPSTTECEKYGGCPYRDICSATKKLQQKKTSFLDINEEGDIMASLEDRIKAKQAAQAAKGINPPDAAKPDVVVQYVAPERPLTVADIVTETPSLEFATRPPPELAKDTALHLYVNCAPTVGAKVDHYLSQLIDDRTPGIIQRLAAKEPNMVPDGAVDVRECKFGSGVAALVADFKRNPPTGVVVVNDAGLSSAVLEALLPKASIVVVGGR